MRYHLKLFTKDNIYDTAYYLDDLLQLVEDYFKELHGEDYVGNQDLIRDFIYNSILNNKSLYTLHKTEEDKVVGWMLIYLNDQGGLTKPVAVMDYIYLRPDVRNGVAIAKMYRMMGDVCIDYNCDGLGTTFNTSSNINNNKIVGGTPLATVTQFKLEDIKPYHDKLKRRK